MSNCDKNKKINKRKEVEKIAVSNTVTSLGFSDFMLLGENEQVIFRLEI